MGLANRFFAFVLFYCLLITFPIVITVTSPALLSEKAMAKGLILFLCLLGSIAFYAMTFKRAAWAAVKNNKAQTYMLSLALLYLIVFTAYAYATMLEGNIKFFGFKFSLLHFILSGVLCGIVMNRTNLLSKNR